MKNLLKKLFCPESPARVAVFTWTLGTVGAHYICFSLFHFLFLQGVLNPWPAWNESGDEWILYTGQTAICLAALLFFLNALFRWGAGLWKKRDPRPLLWLLPAAGCYGAGLYCCIGASPKLFLLNRLHDDPYNFAETFMIDLPLAPEQWVFVFLAGVVLLGAGYLFCARSLAAGEGKKLRQVFGKETLVLWGLALCVHLFALGFALRESCRTAELDAALECRFGRPLTAAALGELYQSRGRADGAFWEKAAEARKELPSELKIKGKELCGWDLSLPDALEPDFRAAYGEFLRRHEGAIRRLEKSFDTCPPLPERDFSPGNLAGMPLPELQTIRNFARLEYGRAQNALNNNGDIETAWKCFLRMENAGMPLRKGPGFLNGVVWNSVANKRLDCIERMLESGLLSNARIARLRTDLEELEKTIRKVSRETMYCEAVFARDALWGLETGKTEGCRIAFAPFRWIFPMVWYHAALDKGCIFGAFLRPDLAAVPRVVPLHYILSSMLVPALNTVGWQFHDLAARTAGMEVLLRAEQYRRKHGSFPAEIPDLPLDPYTKKPLVYHVGEAEIPETFLREEEEIKWCEIKTRTVKVKAVTVRSPREARSNGNPAADRTLVRIRLR
ncbi:MAG: hypothetical protein IJT50_07635 [Lentisphaeria bacterium]|nr:hypothetical protein [Lentisphaeria bacterium]